MQGTIDNMAGSRAEIPRPNAPDMPAAPATELAELLQRQQALAQGLAHDLRSPLRAIDGFAARLHQHAVLDETGRDYVRRIRDSAARMSRLVDALQEYTSAARAVLKREPVDLSLLADWVGAELRDAAPGREARIEVAPGLSVQGDEHYLKRMLAQLLDNAWKFSAPRERIDIRVEGERNEHTLHLRVRDCGIGFDMRYVERLFEPFQRLHGPDEGAGAGLGLAIAHCIVHRHGGSIRAESTAGEGSVFHVALPLAPSRTEAGDG